MSRITKIEKRQKSFADYLLVVFGVIYFLGLASAIGYLWVFAEDRFVTSAEFRISQHEGSVADAGLLSLALPGLTDAGSMDSQIAISYIESADLLLELEKRFNLIEHYSSPEKDFFFRMSKDAKIEDRLEFYRKNIQGHFQEASGLTLITVATFDGQLSKDISSYLLVKAEDFVNRINKEIANRRSEFLHQEVELALGEFQKATEELTELQNQYNFISPQQMIETTLAAVQTMKLELLKLNAEVSTLVRDSPDSPRIEAIRSQIKSLEDLIESESAKLSGAEKDRLNQITKEFSIVSKKVEFRARLLAGAELSIEQNRSDAIANSKFFTVIQNPYLPEDAEEPRRLYLSITLGAIGILAYVILLILAKSIIERG